MVYEPNFYLGDIVKHNKGWQIPGNHDKSRIGYITKIQVENFHTQIWVTFFDEKDIDFLQEEWYNSAELTLVSRRLKSEV